MLQDLLINCFGDITMLPEWEEEGTLFDVHPKSLSPAEGPLLAARDRPLNELLHEGETSSKGGGFKSVPVVACVVNPWRVCVYGPV